MKHMHIYLLLPVQWIKDYDLPQKHFPNIGQNGQPDIVVFECKILFLIVLMIACGKSNNKECSNVLILIEIEK